MFVAAVMTLIAPCVTFGQIAEILDEGELCNAYILACIYILHSPFIFQKFYFDFPFLLLARIAACPLGSFIYLIMVPALCSYWIMGSKYRAKLRKKFDLVEAPYEDAISHALFPCCSLSQEFRELQLRGLNPALGIITN